MHSNDKNNPLNPPMVEIDENDVKDFMSGDFEVETKDEESSEEGIEFMDETPSSEPIKASEPQSDIPDTDTPMDTEDDNFKQHVTLTMDMCTDQPVPDGEFKIPLPSRITLEEVTLIDNPTTEEREWESIRSSGYELRTENGIYSETLKQGDWKQEVKFGEVSCKIRRGVLSPSPDKRISIEDIDLRIKSHLGTGGTIQIPLVNSGFYVTITPPSEASLNLLFNEVMNDKHSVGRDTFGASYSNMSVVTNKRFFNTIMDSITDHTINVDKSKLRKYIKRTDLNLLYWGFVTSMYPKGHYYSRACVHDPDCHHVKEGTLNLYSMLVIDDSKFTDDQRKHMSNLRSKSMSVKAVKAYQESIDEIDTRDVEITTGDGAVSTFTLYNGSATDWFKDGDIWFDDMHNLVIKALGADADESRRSALMSQLAYAAELKAYTHMVKAFSCDFGFGDSPRVVRKALESFSSSEELKEKLVEEIEKYVDRTARYVIGIENYICPACGNPQEQEQRYIIPIDVVASFFTMTVTRVFL